VKTKGKKGDAGLELSLSVPTAKYFRQREGSSEYYQNSRWMHHLATVQDNNYHSDYTPKVVSHEFYSGLHPGLLYIRCRYPSIPNNHLMHGCIATSYFFFWVVSEIQRETSNITSRVIEVSITNFGFPDI
jgi:hypothetical protein